VWIDTGTYIDISQPANRAKFISPDLKPQFLGNDGSRPTGSAPDIFLSGPETAWHTNKGTAGGFTENGALAESATNPVFSSAGDYTSNLVGHWKLDEVTFTSAADSSGNGNNGSLLNGLNPVNDAVTGVRNGAFDFDGTDDYINVGDPGSGVLDVGASDHTIAAWVYWRGSAGTNRIVAKESSTSNKEYTFAVNSAGALGIEHEVGNNDQAIYSASGAVPMNRWAHVAVTFKSSTRYNILYVDGAEVANGTDPALVNVFTAPLNIGRLSYSPSQYFTGLIDDARIYNRALTANDIKALYMNSPRYCSNPDGAAGQMHYNADTHSMMFCAAGEWLSMDGRYRPNAVTFDGVNDYLTRGAGLTGVVDGKTWSGGFWIRTQGLPAGPIQILGTSPNGAMSIRMESNGKIKIVTQAADATEAGSFETSGSIRDDQWHHVLFAMDTASASNSRLYVDGVDALSNNSAQNKDIDFTTTNVYFGANSTPAIYWKGDIADAWFDTGTWIDFSVAANREKFIASGRPVWLGPDGSAPTGTAPEVFLSGATSTWHTNDGAGGGFTLNGGGLASAATSPLDPSSSLLRGLVAHWKLDEDNGTTVNDWAGGNTGAANGGVTLNAAGKVGKAFQFDGVDDDIGVAASPAFQKTSMTLAAWVYIPASIPAGWKTIIEHGRSTSNWYGLWKGSGGNLFHFRWSNTGTMSANFNATISADTWYHVVGAYDAAANTATLYLNGTLDKTVTGGGTGTAASGTLRIGENNSGAEGFPGIIDDVRVYNRALSAAEVTALYNATNAGKVYPDVCANPNGVEGEMMYNVNSKVMQFCNGGYWVGVGK